MKALKAGAIPFLFFLCASSAFSQAQPDWRIIFSDPDSGVSDIDFRSAEPTELPASVSAPAEGASVRGEGNCLWLVSEYSVPSELKDKKLVLNFDEVSGPAELYLNGRLVGAYGKPGDRFFMQSGIHAYFYLSPDMLTENVNFIALKVLSDSENFRVQKPSVGIYDKEINDIWRLSFLNGGIFFAFSVLVFFIGLYYLSLFLFNRSVKINLYFSLANILLGIYFAQMGLPYRILPTVGFLVVSKYSLFLYFTFLTLFFIDFFRVFRNRWVKLAVVIAAVLIGADYLLHSGSYSEIMGVFDTALIPAGAELLLMVGIAGYSLIRKNSDALPVFIGVIVGLASAVYDFYFALSGQEPAFWLQGFGILIFNICMFEMLSVRAIRAEKQLKVSSVQIEENARVMKKFIEKIETVSISVADMSSNLAREIETSAESVEELVKSTETISSSAGEQLENVKGTSESLEALLGSSEQINNELTRQQKDVQETSLLISEMLENITVITENLKKTSDFTEELGVLTARGEAAVTKSAETVSAINEDSKNIYQILSSITDISEQTNLLAMNAAIEAAHAGKAGAGFAVVAGEIRSLAVNTAGRTRETVEQIDNIVSRIKEAYDANLEVKNLLLQIGTNTKTAVEQVKSVYLSVEEQRTASRAVLSTVDSLNESSTAIKNETENQKLRSADMERKQQDLRKISGTVYESTEHITEANTRILSALDSVMKISAGTSAEAVRLKELLTDSDRSPRA